MLAGRFCQGGTFYARLGTRRPGLGGDRGVKGFLIGMLATGLWLVVAVAAALLIRASPGHPFRTIRGFRQFRRKIATSATPPARRPQAKPSPPARIVPPAARRPGPRAAAPLRGTAPARSQPTATPWGGLPSALGGKPRAVQLARLERPPANGVRPARPAVGKAPAAAASPRPARPRVIDLTAHQHQAEDQEMTEIRGLLASITTESPKPRPGPPPGARRPPEPPPPAAVPKNPPAPHRQKLAPTRRTPHDPPQRAVAPAPERRGQHPASDAPAGGPPGPAPVRRRRRGPRSRGGVHYILVDEQGRPKLP